MIPHTEGFSYQKRTLETIVIRRLDQKTPITALTERFAIDRPPHAPSPKHPNKPLLHTGSMAQLMRNLSSGTMGYMGLGVYKGKPVTSSGKLRYPHVKTHMNVSAADLDNYAVKEERAVRRKADSYDEGSSDSVIKKYEKAKAATYLNFAEMKSLDETNRLLRRKLSQVLKQANKPSSSQSSFSVPAPPPPATPPHHKPSTAGTRPSSLNILRFNKSAVCNITSDQPVPRSDVSWKRSMVKSPYTVNTSHWSAGDPKLLNTTVSSQTLKTRFWIQERLDDTTANVFVRYPYCQECTRSAVPIRVQLEKSWG